MAPSSPETNRPPSGPELSASRAAASPLVSVMPMALESGPVAIPAGAALPVEPVFSAGAASSVEPTFLALPPPVDSKVLPGPAAESSAGTAPGKIRGIAASSAGVEAAASHSGACRRPGREKRAIGVDRIGPKDRPDRPGVSRAGGVGRAHEARPARQSRSSMSGVKPAILAGRISSSQAPAGAANPSSSATTAASASSPSRRSSGRTRCHSNRKRMNAARDTGSIWRRRRPRV